MIDSMPKVRPSSGMIGTIQLADLRILQQLAQHADKAHRGRDGAAFRAGQRFLRTSRAPGPSNVAGSRTSRVGHEAAQLLATLLHVADLRAVVGGPIEASLLRAASSGIGISKRERKCGQRLVGQLLLLVGGVARLAPSPVRSPSRFGQDHGRAALVLHRALVGVVDLLRIVAAAAADDADSSSLMSATSSSSSGYLPKNSLRTYAPPLAL